MPDARPIIKGPGASSAAPGPASPPQVQDGPPALRGDPGMERLRVDGGWVELADVVDAANALLATRSDERFVPLPVSFEREAYLRLDWARAALLDRHQLLEVDWERCFDDVPLARAA